MPRFNIGEFEIERLDDTNSVTTVVTSAGSLRADNSFLINHNNIISSTPAITSRYTGYELLIGTEQPHRYWEYFDDWMSTATTGLVATVAGTQASANTYGWEANFSGYEFGVRGGDTGTTATGRAKLRTDGGCWGIFAYPFRVIATYKVAYSAFSGSYFTFVGFGDVAAAGEHQDGFYFYADQTSNFWQIVVAANSVRTRVVTTVPVSASVSRYRKMAIEVVNYGAATLNPSANYYIDDVRVGTFTTGFPSGNARLVGECTIGIEKTAGTTPIDFYWDYFHISRSFPTRPG